MLMRSLAASGKSISSTNAGPSLSVYRAAYRRADEFCKEVQSFIEEAGIPAINEMRYAGHHLLLALDDDGTISGGADIVKATNHAHRACYEAGEAGILCALDKISNFKSDYRTVTVSVVVSNYTEILRKAEEAKARIVAERDQAEDRNSDYEDFRSIFLELKEHCNNLDIARDELNKSVKKETKDARRFVIGVFIAIASLIVAGFGAYFAYRAIPLVPTAISAPASTKK
jgi:hypothetical protein